MKAFEYYYSITWGYGQGIIFAESQDEAMEMFLKDLPTTTTFADLYPKFEIKEIDITLPRILDYSWEE
jgi:hypothetical protein